VCTRCSIPAHLRRRAQGKHLNTTKQDNLTQYTSPGQFENLSSCMLHCTHNTKMQFRARCLTLKLFISMEGSRNKNILLVETCSAGQSIASACFAKLSPKGSINPVPSFVLGKVGKKTKILTNIRHEIEYSSGALPHLFSGVMYRLTA
jgi:hypothetical protein